MGNYNFDKDLSVAEKTQQEIAHILEEKYNAEIINFGNNKDYDIFAKIRGKHLYFEIKEDFLAERTGNIAVEFSCRGKPSGIETTKADYYIYKVHTKEGIEIVVHSVNKIKEMIKKELFFRVVNVGDKGSDSLNYLFKYNIFMRNGKVITFVP